MPLVKALSQRQGGFGREAEFAVGLTLQAGQVEQQRRRLRGGFGFFCDNSGLTAHGIGDGLCLRGVPDAVSALFCVFRVFLPLRVKPFGRVIACLRAKGGVDFPVVAADKFADQFFALYHHAERGGLHAANGRQKEAAIA